MSNKSTLQKYNVQGHSKRYALVTDYVGWVPDPHGSWESYVSTHKTRSFIMFLAHATEKFPAVLVSPNGEKIDITLHERTIKDNLSPSFFTDFTETQSQAWTEFYIIALKDSPKKQFIIPMY